MKIAVVTVFYNTNYGAVLQAYALTKVISEISGRECYLVDYRRKKIINMFRNSIYDIDSKGNRKITKESIKRKIKQIINPIGTIQRFKKFEEFRNEQMIISKQVYFEGESICLYDTDIVFLGSDQIWNPDITQGFNDVYFGNFGGYKYFTISYAASLGKTEFSDEEKLKLGHLINNIDIISVREEQAVQILCELTNKTIRCVPDPTVLIGKKQWLELSSKVKLGEKKYILVYMLTYSKTLVELSYKLSEKYNYKIIFLGTGQSKPIKKMKQKKNCGPREFINYINNAEYVITNSFHGTVFSVIFNKQFYTIPNKTKGSRVINFCNKLGLEKRIIYDGGQINHINIDEYINYEIVKPKLEDLKKAGINFIKYALEEARSE